MPIPSIKISTIWPRTARMLLGISEFYDRDAKRNDIKSDLLDLLGGR